MKKSLLETNPYLKDPAQRNNALVRNVVSSSAIEGVRVIRDTDSGRFVSTATRATAFGKPEKTSR